MLPGGIGIFDTGFHRGPVCSVGVLKFRHLEKIPYLFY